MAYPLVQFVDGPSSTAVLRYDFNARDASTRTHPLGPDGLDLGVPSFSGEPGGVGVDYGYRQIRLTQRIEGSLAVALAKMSLLARELLRSTNWLRVQWAAGAPSVYFKTFRAEPGGVSLEHADTAGAWDITVPLVAEGFNYGPRVTIPTAGTDVVQSPTGTNPMRLVLPAIKGDAPVPLRVVLTPSNDAAGANPDNVGGASWLVGCLSGKTSMTDPITVDIGTGDGLTAGTGTGAPVADAAYFYGSYRAVTIAAATPNLLLRLSGNLPTVPIGRYKALLRYEVDFGASNKTYIAQFGVAQSGSKPVVYGNAVQFTTANPAPSVARGWVDLGEFQLPPYTQFQRQLLDAPTGTGWTPFFGLKLGTADGSAGNGFRMDAIHLIPIDGATVDTASMLHTKWLNGGDTIRALHPGTFDGDAESFWLTNGGLLVPSVNAKRGGFPIADPAAAQNMLIVMATEHGVGFAAGASSITSSGAVTAVGVSYYPRFLYMGDGT